MKHLLAVSLFVMSTAAFAQYPYGGYGYAPMYEPPVPGYVHSRSFRTFGGYENTATSNIGTMRYGQSWETGSYYSPSGYGAYWRQSGGHDFRYHWGR